MQAWIETFFSDPSVLSASTPTSGHDEELDISFFSAPTPSASLIDELGSRWKDEAEMQKLLDQLPKVESEGESNVDVRTGLDLDLSGWSFGKDVAPLSSGIGVF